jgi:lipid-binding SYLF domain-containing protein
MNRLMAMLLTVAGGAYPAAAASPNLDAQRLSDAEEVLTKAINASNGIPKDLMEDAACIGVFPGAAKDQFLSGKEFAQGVVTCRRPDGTMGAPAFFALAAGHASWAFDGDRSDLIVLFMNPAARQRLSEGRATFGPGFQSVGGPVGTVLSTPAQLQAGMLSWAHGAGAFAGVSLDGNVIQQDMKTTTTFYGSPISAKQILLDPNMAPPKATESFVRLTTEYATPAS